MNDGADGGEDNGDAPDDGERSLNLLRARKMPESMLSAVQTVRPSHSTGSLFLHARALKHSASVTLPVASEGLKPSSLALRVGSAPLCG